MSPEQAGGSRDLDGRSDLYSLGCVLYETLAGQPPFTGPTIESVVAQHLSAPAPDVTTIRPSVPGWVVAALQRSLAKTPADRFNPVALFGEAIAPRLSVEAGATVAPSRPRRRLWAAAAARGPAVGAAAGSPGIPGTPGAARDGAVSDLDRLTGALADRYRIERG